MGWPCRWSDRFFDRRSLVQTLAWKITPLPMIHQTLVGGLPSCYERSCQSPTRVGARNYTFVTHAYNLQINNVYRNHGRCRIQTAYFSPYMLKYSLMRELRAPGNIMGNDKRAFIGIVPVLLMINSTSRYVNQGVKRLNTLSAHVCEPSGRFQVLGKPRRIGRPTLQFFLRVVDSGPFHGLCTTGSGLEHVLSE